MSSLIARALLILGAVTFATHLFISDSQAGALQSPIAFIGCPTEEAAFAATEILLERNMLVGDLDGGCWPLGGRSAANIVETGNQLNKTVFDFEGEPFAVFEFSWNDKIYYILVWFPDGPTPSSRGS